MDSHRPSGDTSGGEIDEGRGHRITRRQSLSLAAATVMAGVGALVVVEESSNAPRPQVALDPYYDSPVYRSKSAAIQAAYQAAAAKGAILVCSPGRVYSLDKASLRLRPDTPIAIQGNGATLQANWGRPRCIDFARTADYQTFRDIEINDLIFDANHQSSPLAESVVGNLVSGGGVHMQRINATRITLSRCQWVNVPYGITASYSCFALESLHRGPGERQTALTEIRLEQCRMRGGNAGARVIGTSPGARVAGTSPHGVEVYHDQIYLDIDHDTGVVPTSRVAVTSGNAHIGSAGFGNYCEVHVVGANSADVGVEIDGMQNAVVYGRVTDARNDAFYARNFHAAPHPSTQQIRFVRCESRIVNLNPDGMSYSARGFVIGGQTLPNPRFNWAILEDCSFSSAATNFAAIGQALFVRQRAPVNRVSVVGGFTVACDKVEEDPTSSVRPAVVAMLPGPPAFAFDVSGRIVVTIAGAGDPNVMPRLIWLSPQQGCQIRLAVDTIRLASSLTGLLPGNTDGVFAGGSGNSGGSVSGHVHYLGWSSFSGADTDPSLLNVLPSTLRSGGKLVIDELDLRHSPSSSPTEVRGASDAVESGKIEIRHVSLPITSSSGVS